MGNACLRGASYVLAHAPDLVVGCGTTQTTEKAVNPGSDYLRELPSRLRSFEDALGYAPNQAFIGNLPIEDLKSIPQPWHEQKSELNGRYGSFGEMMPEEELYALIAAVDSFELVKLEEGFASRSSLCMVNHPALSGFSEKIKTGEPRANIETLVKSGNAWPLYLSGELVGCVKRAHDIDANLSAHVMLENLAAKATAVLALVNLAVKNGIDLLDIDYIIECSEEACGDMNQRGGGNFAKAVAEAAGALNATGSDTRGFCAAPVHALIEAASLVSAGTFGAVAIVAGGSVAKLGMNGKDHVKKGVPILEDMLGGFAALITRDDYKNPVINLSCVGSHKVSTGSAPQAVITSLTADPLSKAGLRLTDVDKFAAELQNPDITKPAGAGDVPEANFKMIAALAVMRGEINRADIPSFIEKRGMPGFAPTQGHIPSGAPYLGTAIYELTRGNMSRVMIIGKGSLFLGRMTNLFDGMSVLLERNAGKKNSGAGVSVYEQKVFRVGLTINDCEHGKREWISGAMQALKRRGDVSVTIIGEADCSDFNEPRLSVVGASRETAHREMESLLESKRIDACVTAHYSFPIGVSTVGLAQTPATGREMLVATTTGAASAEKNEALVLNALYGIAAAKALSISDPAVGLLNIDGAAKALKTLRRLAENGYAIRFAESERSDGGALMRGNDALRGGPDVLVADTLTGNLLMKLLSSFTTGGSYESTGSGYGPGLGENFTKLVLILSRASGAPVAANAVSYAADLIAGDIVGKTRAELSAAKKAGLDQLFAESAPRDGGSAKDGYAVPQKEVVTAEIMGIDILRLEEAVCAMHRAGIYAESGMGCTGPIVMVSEKNLGSAEKIAEPFK